MRKVLNITYSPVKLHVPVAVRSSNNFAWYKMQCRADSGLPLAFDKLFSFSDDIAVKDGVFLYFTKKK